MVMVLLGTNVKPLLPRSGKRDQALSQTYVGRLWRRRVVLWHHISSNEYTIEDTETDERNGVVKCVQAVLGGG
jgi:hypothetical protein